MMLVTGGAGYLGGHLAQALLERGEPVRILDVQRTKYVPDGAEFVKGDMRSRAMLRKCLAGVDTVFHLAFVQSLSKLPEAERWDININGSENVFRESVAAKVRRFVHTSTIEIYGTRPPFPCPEDAPTNHPVGWYGRHKLEAEKILWRYHRDHGLPAAAVRMPTICGPGYYNHRPTLDLMERILDHKFIPVVGRGDIRGDFVYFKDVLRGYLLCAGKEAAVGEAFNISTDRSSTHLEIVQALIRAAGSRSRVVHVPPWLARPMMDVTRRLGLHDLPPYQDDYLFHPNSYSVEKAKRLLGYRPTKSAAEAAVALMEGYMKDREFVRKRSRNY